MPPMQMICILYYNDSYSYVNEYANDLHVIKKEAVYSASVICEWIQEENVSKPSLITFESEVKPKRKAHVVAVIGDSITDGATATLDANTRWTDFLAKRLSPHQVAVINSGISGNRLLTDGMGDSALDRLKKEIFQYSGVKTLIVLVGVIGKSDAPKSLGQALE